MNVSTKESPPVGKLKLDGKFIFSNQLRFIGKKIKKKRNTCTCKQNSFSWSCYYQWCYRNNSFI